MQSQPKYRLLVVRLGAMGDILHALPAVTALRLAHPEWGIDWVVEPTWKALLTADSAAATRPSPAQPLVDKIHFAPTKQWRRQPISRDTRDEILKLRQTLRDEHYDAVIDLQGAIRSAVVGRMAGARRFIGESNPREGIARWLFTERIAVRGVHVIEQDLELAGAVAGDVLRPARPVLPLDPAAESWADGLLSPSEKGILINPGAGWGAKRWPIERYAELARALLNRGFRVFVNAGPGEVALANIVVQRTGGGATPLLGSLEHLIAIARRVSLAIAGDTGPLHLACALGRPVVGVYGPTDPLRNGPFGTRFRVLRSPLSRRDHSRREDPEAGLLTITCDEVLTAAEELLYPEASQ